MVAGCGHHRTQLVYNAVLNREPVKGENYKGKVTENGSKRKQAPEENEITFRDW